MDHTSVSGLTPLMQQYFQLRTQYDDAILLFQVGDFYELFFDDAQKVATFLGIALTKRGTFQDKPIPLCGFPVHVLDHYVAKLVKGGFKVALCQQLEQAVTGKMVARGVTQVFTPGTLTAENLLDAKSSSYLFAFFPLEDSWGLLFSELVSLQIHATVIPSGSDRSLETELYRFLPDEVVLQKNQSAGKFETFFKQRGFFTTRHQGDFQQEATEKFCAWRDQQFSDDTKNYLQDAPALTQALQLWHSYIQKNQKDALGQFKDIHFYTPDQFLLLDAATQKNLEIVVNSADGSKKNTLLSCIDTAVTPMGSRMIRRWLLRPLVDVQEIYRRQQVILALVQRPQLLFEYRLVLQQCGDLQRIVGRISLQKAGIKDYIQLKNIVAGIPQLRALLQSFSQGIFEQVLTDCVDMQDLHLLLHHACHDDPTHDWLIKTGFDAHLDMLRDCIVQSDVKLLELEVAEQQRTGITTLKIRQNNVHGYYIEVTKANADLVPVDYIRQQTLVGRERYTTPMLQQMQAQAFQAQNSIQEYEKNLFEQLKEQVAGYTSMLRKASESIATLDALVGFAYLAYEQGYVRPEFTPQQDIIIVEGKHPVVAMQLGHQFIPNDTKLVDDASLWVVTGPNMGGKSTYLRQVALICILAQTGSFVPARYASLPILDRIFTRIGAGDNLAEGKSTFFVEMEETAQICLQATAKSLVILDEVGRGTSTYDGLAIAQAVVEYIYSTVKARCLFATHYHELTYLQEVFPSIKAFYADSKKTEQGILFLHKIVPGIARQSFGLEVAKLAKLPTSVLIRAQTLVEQFEHKDVPKFEPAKLAVIDSFHPHDQYYKNVCDEIRNLDCNDLTAKQALDYVWSLQQKLKNKSM